jgi:endonuclease YncB( thermonuclease family)
MSLLKSAAIASGLALCFAASGQDDAVVVGVVTGVIDGDTIRVQLGSGPATVRLGHIDAPESYQAGGVAATRALHGRVVGEEVSLHVVKGVQGETLVAVVFLGDENINAWMVKQGHAWAYRGFAEDPNYCLWENAARSLRRGLWANPSKDWVAPWDWRMSKRDALFFVSDYSNASAAGCLRGNSQRSFLDD